MRELEQCLRAAALRAERARAIGLDQLPAAIAEAVLARVRTKEGRGAEIPLGLVVSRHAAPSADELTCVLRRFGGNMAQAAAFFGKDRRQIYRWVRRHGIEIETLRKP